MEVIDLGKTPISDASPAGGDVRNDPAYEGLSAEIEKLSSPTASGGVDWRKVLDLSREILSTRSKDLLVFSYLSMALLKTGGLKGLATGVHVMRDGLSTFWETMFPAKARMRGRKNALDWWAEKTASALAGLDPEEWQKEAADAFFDDLKAIDAFLGENMDDAPSLGPLTSAAGSLVSAAQESKPEPASPPPPASPQGAQPAQPTPAPPRPAQASPVQESAPGAEGDPDKLVRAALDSLRGASTLILRQNPFNPLRFRFNRVAAWVSVSAAPANQGGKTLIPPPDGQIMDTLKTLRQSQDWQNLLEAAESRVTEFLFWLDLHRYVAESLENLGHKGISAEVADETSLYVKRLPGIERLSFSDGTAFADTDTKEWLDELTRKAGASASGASGDHLAEITEQEAALARAQAKEGDLAGALRSLKDKMDGASSSRERFLRRIAFCRFLTQTGQAQIAAPYVQELLQDLDMYKVETWEPLLAVECLVAVLSSLTMEKDGKDEETRQKALRRLSLLDPARSLSFMT